MIAANVRTRAVMAQERSHAERCFHRERQKQFEAEEQTFKKLIRAIDDKEGAERKIAALLSDASDAMLSTLGLLPAALPPAAPAVVDVESAAVVDATAVHPAVPAADGPAEARPADDDRGSDDDPEAGPRPAGDAVAPAAAVADQEDAGGQPAETAPIEPPVRRVPRFAPEPAAAPRTALESCTDRVMTFLNAEREGNIASVEWPQMLRSCGSPKTVSNAIKLLEKAGRIRKAKGGEGGLTFIIRDVPSEAAE